MVSLLANSCLFTHVANMEWDYRAKYLLSFLVLTSYREQDLSLSLLRASLARSSKNMDVACTQAIVGWKTFAVNSHIIYKRTKI